MFFGPKIRSIDTSEIAEELKQRGAVLLDVREPSEYRGGHVPGAKNVPLGTLPGGAARIATDAHVLVICHSGSRSVAAAKILMRAGYSDVTNVRGGTSAYRGALKR